MAEEKHPIQSALEREGMSIRELARRMARPGENEENVRRSIGKWLAGEANPSVPSAKRIADVLGGQASDYRARRQLSGAAVAGELAALRAEVAALRAALGAAPAPGHAGGGGETATPSAGLEPDLVAAQALVAAAEALVRTARQLEGRVGARSQSA